MREAHIIAAGNIICPQGQTSFHQQKNAFRRFFVGELSGIRTPDTLLKRQVLCLLS